MCQKDIKKIHYFKDIVSIEQIKKGYYERKKYKVIGQNENYFIKTHHRKLIQQEIVQEKKLYEIYQKLNIPIVPLLDLIEYKNETIFVYPYFDGITLKDAKLMIEEYYKYGVKIAQEVMKLQRASVDSKLFSKVNLDKYFKENEKRIKDLWKNEDYQEKILYIFSKEELQNLTIHYTSLLDFMKTQKFLLNHNDIKIANVMLDQKKNYYLIDIDPIGLTPTGFNIYYSIHSFLLPQFKENEKSFLRGFIQTIDPNREIIKQLQYCLIADMINESEMLLTKYFNEIQQNKEYIKKMLFNKERFLEEIVYGS